jgi:uncharacterized protein YbjT (DUF2867 family)
MNILIFGATGMVGQGVLRECLAAGDVEHVTALSRMPTGLTHSKLREVIVRDLFDVASYSDRMRDAHACFFCLGVQSSGLAEEEYSRLTYDLTLAVSGMLVTRDPQMTFIYVSGLGTDATESGSSMWARVKGRTENALRKLPFKAVHLFRPAAILPVNGEQSKTPSYRYFYNAAGWLLRPMRNLSGGYILTTEDVGQAMLTIARQGWPDAVLEPPAIRKAADLFRLKILA